jgi:hypothetical protein
MRDQPWFHGQMSREEACDLLRGRRPGEFVVRVSGTNPGLYAISVMQPADHIEHMLILPSWVGAGACLPPARPQVYY